MDLAAGATFDVIAPAPRAPAEPAAQTSTSEQDEFGEILGAATRQDDEQAEAAQSAKKQPKAEEQPEAALAATPAPPQEQASAPALITLLAALEPAQQAGADEQAPPIAPEQTKTGKSLEAAEKSETPIPSQLPAEAKQPAALPAAVESAPQPVTPAVVTPVIQLAAELSPEQTAQPAAPEISVIQSVQIQAAGPRPTQPRQAQPQQTRAEAAGAEAAANDGDPMQSAAKPADVDMLKAALKGAESQRADRPSPADANAPAITHQASAGAPHASPPAMTMSDAFSATLSNATAATATGAAAAHAQAARTPPPAAQVAQDIIRRFDGGSTTFDLRLDPPELGRVEVRLEVSRDHRVTAVVAADNPQALAELARHARDLEQSLQSAGLMLSDNGLSFDLRQGGDRSANARQVDAGELASGEDGDAAAIETAPVSARPIGFERWRGVRVDITV